MVESPYKFELKFFISPFDHHNLLMRLRPLMRPDSNGGPEGSYGVRSLYFDDIQNHGLNEKLNGVNSRSKYRIRIYNNDSGFAKLEKKSKTGQMSRKQHCKISAKEIECIRAGDIEFLKDSAEPLRLDFYRHVKNNRLKPIVIVDYHRNAFVLPEQDIRVTLDRKLCSGLNSTDLLNPSVPLVPMLDNGIGILEIKFVNHFPDNLRNAIQIGHRSRVSICKFAICRKLTKHNPWEDS